MFGAIADAQYCDCAPLNERHYRASLWKMQDAVRVLDSVQVDFSVHLGDLIDRHYTSYEPIDSIFRSQHSPTYYVLGNHEFDIPLLLRRSVPKTLGIQHRYSSISYKGWRFIFLDETDVSLYSHSPRHRKYHDAVGIFQSLTSVNAPNAKSWNGGIGQAQLEWLDRTLSDAEVRNQRVVIFSHFPVYPRGRHNLWNDEEVVALLESHSSVVAYINGHNHAGRYATRNGIHYVSLKGMVETEHTTAFSIITLRQGRIDIEGYGRERTRLLQIDPAPLDYVSPAPVNTSEGDDLPD